MVLLNYLYYLLFFFFFSTFQRILGDVRQTRDDPNKFMIQVNLSEEYLCERKIFMFCTTNNAKNSFSQSSLMRKFRQNTIYLFSINIINKYNTFNSQTGKIYFHGFQLNNKNCFYMSPDFYLRFFEWNPTLECRDYLIQLRLPFDKSVERFTIEEQGYLSSVTSHQFLNERFDTHKSIISVKWNCNDIKHLIQRETSFPIEPLHFFCDDKRMSGFRACTPAFCFDNCEMNCHSLLSFHQTLSMRKYNVGMGFTTAQSDFKDFLGRFNMDTDDYMLHCMNNVNNNLPSYSINNLQEDASVTPERMIKIPFNETKCSVITKSQIRSKTKDWKPTNTPYNLESSSLREESNHAFFLKSQQVIIKKREVFQIPAVPSEINIFHVMESCDLHYFSRRDILTSDTVSIHYQLNDHTCVWIFFHKNNGKKLLPMTYVYEPILHNVLSFSKPYVLLNNENRMNAKIHVFNKKMLQYICFRSADPSVSFTKIQSFMQAKILIYWNWIPISYFAAEYTLALKNNALQQYQCIYLSLLELEILRAKFLSVKKTILNDSNSNDSLPLFLQKHNNQEEYYITFFFKEKIPLLEAHLFSQSIIKLDFAASSSSVVVVNSPFLAVFHSTHSPAFQFSVSDLLYYYKEIETLPCNLEIGEGIHEKSSLTVSNELKRTIQFNKLNEESIYRLDSCSNPNSNSQETFLTTATLDHYSSSLLCLCSNGFYRIFSRIEVSNCYKVNNVQNNMLLVIQSYNELPIPPPNYSFHYTFDKNVKKIQWSLSLKKALQGVLFTTCFYSPNTTDATRSLKMSSIDISFEYLFKSCDIKPSRFTRIIKGKITEHCTMMLTSQLNAEEVYQAYKKSPYANVEYHHMYITQNFRSPTDAIQQVSVHLSQVTLSMSDLQKFTHHNVTMQPQILIQMESFCYSSTRALIETPFGNYYRQHAIFLDTSRQNVEDGSSPCSIILIWQGKSYVQNTKATVKFLNTLKYYQSHIDHNTNPYVDH